MREYSATKYSSQMQKQIFKRRVDDLDHQEAKAKSAISELRSQKISEDSGKTAAQASNRESGRPRDNLPDGIDRGPAAAVRQQKLAGQHLLTHCLSCSEQNIPETSVCLRAGYTVEEIGQFRREFSRSASVKFGPLDRMIRELASRDVDPHSAALVDEPATAPGRKDRQVHSVVKTRSADFRDNVLEAHGLRCVCCPVAIAELLEAAHIVPVSNSGSDHCGNGLPLCPLHHKAFDRHLFAIDPDSRSIVYRSGLTPESLRISESKIESKVSREALLLRMGLFLKHASQQ